MKPVIGQIRSLKYKDILGHSEHLIVSPPTYNLRHTLRKKIVTVTVFTFSFGLKVHYNQDDRKCTVIWTVLTKNVVFTEGTHVHRLQATRINLRLTRLMQTCD